MGEIFRVPNDHDRAIQEIVKKMNEIINSVAQKPTGIDNKNYVGTPGSFQIEKKDDGSVVAKFKTEDGWFETSALKLKES